MGPVRSGREYGRMVQERRERQRRQQQAMAAAGLGAQRVSRQSVSAPLPRGQRPQQQQARPPARTVAPRTDASTQGGRYGRRRSEPFRGSRRFERAVAEAREVRRRWLSERYTHRGTPRRVIAPSGPDTTSRVVKAGIGSIPVLSTVARVPIVGDAARGIVEAFVRDPINMPARTAKGAAEFAVAAPAGIVQVAKDVTIPLLTGRVGQAAEGARDIGGAMLEDFERRYGPLLQGERGYREFVERVREEGAAAELLDAASVAAPTGAVAGRALGSAARAGRLGRRLQDAATRPRPRLRVSGNVAREQELSANLFRALAQRGQDRLRERVQERRVRRADQVALRGEREAPRPMPPGPGEVAPLSRRLAQRAQRKDVSEVQSRAYTAIRREVGEQIHRAEDRERRKLSRTERRAVFHAVQGLLPFSRSAGELRSAARARRQQIIAEREAGAIARYLQGRGLGAERARDLTRVVAEVRRRDPHGSVVEALRRSGVEVDPRVLRAADELEDVLPRVTREVPQLAGQSELTALRFIEEHADELAGNERLLAYAAGARERVGRSERDTVGLDPVRAEVRRYAPQAEVLGIENPFLPDAERRRVARAQRRVAQAERAVRERQRELREAQRGEAYRRGRVEVLAGHAAARAKRQLAKVERTIARHERAAANYRRRREAARAKRAEELAERARQRAAELEASIGRQPRRSLAALERDRSALLLAERRLANAKRELREARAELRDAPYGVRVDPKLQGKARAKALEQARAQKARAWVEQVRARAREAGLDEPGYVPHQENPTLRRGDFTLGNIARAMRGPKQSGMALFREGRATANPRLVAQAIATNIKRKHQWRAVAAVGERHALPWSRGKRGEGISVKEARRRLTRAGLALHDFVLIDMGRFRTLERALADGDEAGANATLYEALRETTIRAGRKAGEQDRLDVPDLELVEAKLRDQGGEELVERFRRKSGVYVVPKGAADELLAGLQPPGLVSRVSGKVTGLTSAAILGLNPSWLAFQVAANVFATVFGQPGALLEMAKAHRMYRRLSKAERDRLDDMLGIGLLESTRSPQMGTLGGPLTEVARQFGDSRVGRALKAANPVRLMFTADAAQNAAFRRAVLTSAAKREAFRRIRRESGRMAEAVARVEQLLRLKPGEPVMRQVERILAEPETVERLAKHVNNVLGDYTRYTARERRYLRPYVMFYGFLRYATRLAFYTMPVRHPVMASIALKLGQLHVEEVKDLLGGDQAPWAFGRVFFEGKNGDLRSVDLLRMNPVTTPLTEALSDRPKALLGLSSPVVAAALDQVFGGVGFLGGRGFRVRGSARENRNPEAEERLRIVVDDVLSSVFPYRAANQFFHGKKGVLGDDSLLWDPRPLEYRTPKARARNQQRIERSKDGPASLLEQFVPFIPRPDFSREAAQGLPQAPGRPGGSAREDRLDEIVDRALGRQDAVPAPAGGRGPDASREDRLDEIVDRLLAGR